MSESTRFEVGTVSRLALANPPVDDDGREAHYALSFRPVLSAGASDEDEFSLRSTMDRALERGLEDDNAVLCFVAVVSTLEQQEVWSPLPGTLQTVWGMSALIFVEMVHAEEHLERAFPLQDDVGRFSIGRPHYYI